MDFINPPFHRNAHQPKGKISIFSAFPLPKHIWLFFQHRVVEHIFPLKPESVTLNTRHLEEFLLGITLV